MCDLFLTSPFILHVSNYRICIYKAINCHYPEPSHLVPQGTLLPLISFISMTNCFNHQTVTNYYLSREKKHIFLPLTLLKINRNYVVHCFMRDMPALIKFFNWLINVLSLCNNSLFYSGVLQPTYGLGRLVFTFLDHTQLGTPSRTPHNEWSARRRGRATCTTHNKRTSML